MPEATEAAPATASPASLARNSTANSDSGVTPDFVVAPETYTATAYSLRGRTASGQMVSRGLIAADPRVLPLGSRVRVEAGSWSGEYLVADTGGAIKGRRIDIWTTTTREALQFGRRTVKLTVLEFGGKRAKSVAVRPRRVNGSAPVTSPMVQTPNKQDQ
jgi:3D (Asp-Asp-Asp) domain-containing protein